MKVPRAVRQIVILALIAQRCLVVGAQEQSDLLQDLEGIKDPFKSQLPEPVVIVNKPVIQTVEVESGRSRRNDPIEPLTVAPVVSVVLQGPNIEAFVLKGLVWNTDSPQAIVNDRVVKVGDAVNGIKIVAIRQDGVEFSLNGISRVLRASNRTGAGVRKP